MILTAIAVSKVDIPWANANGIEPNGPKSRVSATNPIIDIINPLLTSLGNQTR